MARILVSGGLGAVGSVLVKELRRRGHDVWVCDLSHHHEPQYVRCDVGSFLQLERVFDGRAFDFVYHLAAEFGRWNGEDFYDTLWRTNTVGTKNLIRLQERLRFRMIFFSSSEVYGDYDGVMVEDVMDQYEIKQLNDYAMTKWVGELQVINSAKMYGTETVRVRLFNTYGPGERYSPYRSAICIFCYRALKGERYPVYVGHRRTSSFVTDSANTLANICDNFLPGEAYNVAGLEEHDMKGVSDIVLAQVGRDDSIVDYKEVEPFTTRAKRVDISKAKRDLGHDGKVGLVEGIARTIEWMRSVYGFR